MPPWNWSDSSWGPPQPYTVPDVEAARTKDGDTPKIEMLVWLTLGLAATLVINRMYYHIFRGRRYLWSDDYFLIAALLSLIGNAVAIEVWVPYKYEPNVTTTVPVRMILSGSLMGLFNSLALAFSKTSLAITFMRLTTGWWKSGLGLAIFVMNILFAVQAWSYWIQDCTLGVKPEPFRVQGTHEGCITFQSITQFRLVVQILSCTLDAYFTILPWMIVRSLKLKRFEKIGLAIAMSFGCASLSTGLARMAALIRLKHESSEYQPMYAVGGFLCNYFEPSYSIVAACMPVLRKTFMDMIQWKKNTSAFQWIQNWRKKPALPVMLPLTEFPGDLASEGKNTSNQTDTTLVRPTTHTESTTPSPPGSCHTSNKPVHSTLSSKKLTDLPCLP
ncbi:hypothetical protein F5X98DRAFT_378057 [Xylaria grammica]|nr:hypothetical protein F5X98DRAFT_378057 [Xylaria grammica]